MDEFEQHRQTALRLEKKRKNLDEIGLEGLRSGQVWRPKTDNIILPTFEREKYFSDYDLGSKSHFVVIKDANPRKIGNYNIIKVIPVDDNLSRVTEDDIVIPAQFNPCEKDLLLQVWNEKEMLVENLESCFGTIAKEWIEAEQKKHRITPKIMASALQNSFPHLRKK